MHSFTQSFLSGLPKNNRKGVNKLALNDLLKRIDDAGEPVSAKDVGSNAARFNELEKEGLVQRPKKDNVRKTGKQGRPAHLWTLTAKAKKRVARIREAEKKEKQGKAAAKAAQKVAASTPAA
jgi:predicted ArsR family transcriptional regulator